MAYTERLRFAFRIPTRVVFSLGGVANLPSELDLLGVRRPLLVTDRGLARTPVVARVREVLVDRLAGTFDQVEPDSSVATVHAGADLFRSTGADGLVTVGGGSSIDTSKTMQILLKLGGKLEDHSGINLLDAAPVPHLAVPTTAGTGSEVSYAAVVRDPAQGKKLLFADPYLFPSTALLDPELTLGLPAAVTAATGMDAACHCVEAIHSRGRNPLADALAVGALGMIREHLPRAFEHGDDRVARGQMLIAANMAGMAFTNAQVGIIHALAHSVGARCGVPHGVANAILMPPSIEFNAPACGDRYRLVVEAMGERVEDESPAGIARTAARAMAALAKRVGVPGRLREVGVKKEDLLQCAVDALGDGSILTNPRRVSDPSETLSVLERAY